MSDLDKPWPPLIVAARPPRWMTSRDHLLTFIMWLLFAMMLETQFDVSIPDDDFLKARTPRDLMEMVSRLKNQGSLA